MDHLTQEVQRAEEQVALYKAQCSAQSQDSAAVKEALAEATMELEVRRVERVGCGASDKCCHVPTYVAKTLLESSQLHPLYHYYIHVTIIRKILYSIGLAIVTV